MHPRTTVLLGVFALALVLLRPVAVAYAQDIPRMPDGRPDLSGTYDTATLTPVAAAGRVRKQAGADRRRSRHHCGDGASQASGQKRGQ